MHTIRTVELVLVLILAWVLAGIMMQADTLLLSASTSNIATKNHSSNASVDLAVIRETALFGQVSVVTKVEDAPIRSAPVTAVVVLPLPLKLWGTVVAGESSVAILAVGAKPEQKVFHLHESIGEGVSLDIVWTDAVEVLDHGQKRRIELRQPVGGVKTPQPMPPNVLPPPAGMVQRTISRKMINRQTRNFAALLSQARVVPHFVNGKADGFVINNIAPHSLFQQIGLRNGDIIRKVNQKVISSAAQAMLLYRSLQKSTEIQLEVERSGHIQTINYHIQ